MIWQVRCKGGMSHRHVSLQHCLMSLEALPSLCGALTTTLQCCFRQRWSLHMLPLCLQQLGGLQDMLNAVAMFAPGEECWETSELHSIHHTYR